MMRWVFWLYAAVVFLISKILKTHRKLKENSGEEIYSSLKVSLTIIRNIIVFLVGFMIFLWSVMTDEYYIFFTENRTEKIQEKFGITADENINLKRYRRFWGGMDSGSCLRLDFESRLDGSEFMERNCKGENKSYNSDYDYFRYSYGGKTFTVTFAENDGLYNGSIIY